MMLKDIDPAKIDVGRRTPEQAERLRKMIRWRQQGLTWAVIGNRLGITRQAAVQAVKKFLRRQSQ